MTDTIQLVMEKMIALYAGDARRIQHFTKVYTYASLIGRKSLLDNRTQEILEIAALTHDIGIHTCEAKYGQCGGALQEKEGPAIAERLLKEAAVEEAIINRVCYLIGHHHTYTGVDGLDWQILLEADFLVNGLEDAMEEKALESGYQRVFQTPYGKELCRLMFGV